MLYGGTKRDRKSGTSPPSAISQCRAANQLQRAPEAMFGSNRANLTYSDSRLLEKSKKPQLHRRFSVVEEPKSLFQS